ncbi:3-hydroxyacyl-CoA dehydrogenase [Microcella alkalica]|uniref:NAD(P)-dependent dehydrogenase (Short-subunit alcohol dehydrogenase family) n=1 Tax=Microcella alkalica TaxID=355930 RepID=A0A839EF48_9MICO|nr:SDR family NAD(P)-dependent oxidoreductase [Microcella alkalica]MBA8847935.1 NAD(P)-dependent dehydrogenase (short-subunit alcohol dehydrogenase family) [Microcella alkalica]
MHITGRTALITGGASGLGRATAERMLAAGSSVVIADLPQSPGAALADEWGDRAVFVPTDVTDADQVQAAIDAASELGRLDVVVACAGIVRGARVVGRKGPFPLDVFRQVVDINLTGTFTVVSLAAARMVETGAVDGVAGAEVDEERGVIVMTASVAAFDGQVGQAAYSASKGAIVGLTLPLARDLAEHRIRVMAIAPSLFRTPMAEMLPEEALASLEEQTLHPHRLGKPEEYAALVQHIVENPMLNGEVIRLDGAVRMAPR